MNFDKFLQNALDHFNPLDERVMHNFIWSNFAGNHCKSMRQELIFYITGKCYAKSECGINKVTEVLQDYFKNKNNI